MSNRKEGIVSIVAALIVLFSSMLNPIISVVLAVMTLIGIGLYGLLKKPQVLPPLHGQTERKEREKVAIVDLVESGSSPLTNERVRQELGLSESTVTRYLDELEREGKIRQVGKTGAHVYYEKV